MKKIVCRFLVCLLFLAPFAAIADYYTAPYTYTVSDGKATITGFTNSYSGALSITNTLGGFPVTTIGNYAFKDCEGLTSVTISTNVTTIGDGAFSSCTSLTSVTIPSRVTSIGAWVFSGCDRLTNIAVDSANSVYSSAGGVLFNKAGTRFIQYPGGKAGAYTIPSSVTSIGNWAFYFCTGLVSVTVSSSVVSIGDNVFSRCSGLTNITVDVANPVYSSVDGALIDKNRTTLIQCPEGKAGGYTIPSSVTSIGVSAFSGCTRLTSVAIPSSVTSIGVAAFSGCASLTSVTIPSSVTYIGHSVFYRCTSLTGMTIPSSVTVISDFVFYSCLSLTSVTISSNVVLIGDSAFDGCDSLTRVTIPSRVTSIGADAFSRCFSLTSVLFKGDVPSSAGSDIFRFGSYPTVYRLAGASGWESFFAGRPVIIWDGVSIPLISSAVYRFWSPVFSGHFFTMNEEEKNNITGGLSAYWTYEGVAYVAYTDQKEETLPVYRFWSPVFRGHFYTIHKDEMRNVIGHLSAYWTYEGVAWYAYPTATTNSTVPVYRFWSPVFSHHFFTASEEEKSNISGDAGLSAYWRYEGIAYHAIPTPRSVQDSRVVDASADQLDFGAMPQSVNGTAALSEVEEVLDMGLASQSSERVLGDVVFPLVDAGGAVNAFILDYATDKWTCIVSNSELKAEAVFTAVQSGHDYRIEVWADDSAGSDAVSLHASSFRWQLDPPATLDGDTTLSEGDAIVGAPVARLKTPTNAGTLTLKLYSSSQGVIETRENVAGGDTVEFSLPIWNRWYWVGGWRDTDNTLVMSLWMRHETEE